MKDDVHTGAGKKTTFKEGVTYLLIIIAVAVGLSVLLSRGLIRLSADRLSRTLEKTLDIENTAILGRVTPEDLDKYQAGLQKDIASMTKKLDSYIPRQAYLIVNTANNTFRLMKYDKLIREGICSTGSYTILTAGDDQKWVFETPRGMLKVLGKEESPVWVKPDWAFIEEGLPVPPPGHSSRYERGVLGDYKMMLGRGYLIHGTLYKRFLGMAVTHGCIRLGDDDLESVYKNLQIGSRVFIY